MKSLLTKIAKKCTLAFFLFKVGIVSAQFPLFDGKETSGILTFSGSNTTYSEILPISYEIAKSKLKFSFLTAIPDTSVKIAPQNDIETPNKWVPLKLRSLEFSLTLDEFRFDLLNSSNFDLNFSYIPLGRRIDVSRNIIKNGKTNQPRRLYFFYSFKPSALIAKKDNFFKEAKIDSFSSSNIFNSQIGLSTNASLQFDISGVPKWALGLNVYLGYSFNDLRTLSSKDLCIESKSGIVNNNSAIIYECSEILTGNTENLLESVWSFDFSKSLFSPFKSVPQSGNNKLLAEFNNPSVHLLTRLQVGIRENAKPEYKGLIGLSLARADRQIYASFLIDLIGLFDNNEDAPSLFTETKGLNAFVSLPITSK